ncbi:MAG: alpha/beta fold hydrolase [Candidatus Micrarchaeia archaeon]
MEKISGIFSALEAHRDSNPMKAVFVHGYQGHPMGGFRPYLKRGLEARGWSVSAPAMPSPDEPRAEEWVAAIAKEVGIAGEGCVLVGHSLGCIAILRYLEGKGRKVRGAVLVAGFAEKLGDDFKAIEGFVEKPLDFAKVRGNCGKMVAIFSDNDPYVPLSQAALFEKKLGAKTVVLHARGHFSSSEGTTELPEALAEIVGMER